MDIKSAFLYGTIEEEVYVTQPPGFKDPDHPDKVYKVVKALYRLHQAPRACQDKYGAGILKKFNYTDVKSTLTLVDLEKPLAKDEDADDVDVHLYRSMIGSLMYLTASRLDFMFAVCACARFQVIPKTSHLLAVKRIFRYLKGKPTLGLWYSKDSPFELCKKQTVVATSTTEAEYVAAPSCCRQVLWIQNQLLDYEYNFMNTVINIDNNNTICIIENPVQHSKTKHIEIRHHFIRDCNAKKLIQMVKIHTDYNVANLLTKGFDAGSMLKESKASRHVKRGRDTKIPQSSGPPEKGSGPRCQDTILGDVDAQTRFKITSKRSNDPPLSRGYTLGSREDNMKLLELMELFQVPAAKESDGFVEIIDFLKASSVHYALTVNPIIYTSCIEQFWATAKVQTVNGVRQLHALVDKKKVIITESSIRSDLHLVDAEGTDCLPIATIFEELARMGAKSNAWNEFSSTMASLIICLATNQKFNLSKYIFDAMVKHLDGGVKFLMYPRFVQVFINQQLGDMSQHKKIFVNPFHTKKVFANMKRAGKDFSGRITPLFDTIMVQVFEEVCEDSDHPTDQPSTSSQPKQKQKSKRRQRKEAEVPQDETEHEESVSTPSNDPQPSGEDRMQLNHLMVLCTKLQAQVLDLEKAKDAQAKDIVALKKRV
ncbi:putative ribonuclease H-like domain-containing protein [Tanacetum coccineum]